MEDNNIECFADCEYKKLFPVFSKSRDSVAEGRGYCILEDIVITPYAECGNFVQVERVINDKAIATFMNKLRILFNDD